MKIRTPALLVLMSVLLVVGIATIRGSFRNQQPSIKNDERRGSIKWFVKRAKEQKKTKIFVPPSEELYAVVKGLDDASSHYAVLVVQPLEQKPSILNDTDIITWHKLKVLEVISYPSKGCALCSSGLVAPPEMLPLNAEEILVPTSGGVLSIDGIELETRQRDFGDHFSLSNRYLIFLAFDPANSTGKLSLGSRGVFLITPSDQISPLVKDKSPLNQDLELRLGNSLNRIRDHLRNRPN